MDPEGPRGRRESMSILHVAKDELPSERPMPGYETCSVELGEYTVVFESMPEAFPPDIAFKGLPHDACQCPHWGFLFKGRFVARFIDGREVVVTTGQAYYLPPGHTFRSLEPCETVWFSPTKEFNETFDLVARNVEAFLSAEGRREGGVDV
jgi:hypothetical protein